MKIFNEQRQENRRKIIAAAGELMGDEPICITAVRMGFWYWLKALISGRFEGWPGVRLYGTVGQRRKARPGEVDR